MEVELVAEAVIELSRRTESGGKYSVSPQRGTSLAERAALWAAIGCAFVHQYHHR